MAVVQWINEILKYLILIVCLLMLFYMFLGRKSMNVSSLKQGIRILWKRKAGIIFAGFLFLVLFCATEYYINSRLPVLQIKLNYEEASKGQNPNGTRFNSSDILADEILEEVIRRGNFQITADELSSCLYLGTSFDRQSFSQTDLRVATEYWVSPSPWILRYGIDGRSLMNILGDVYYEQFLGKYTENDSILDLTFENMDDWDYLDITDYLRVKANKLYHYIDSYAVSNPSYRDDETGESLASIREKVGNFLNVELERYDSYVLQNGLSKNRADYINQMDYENRLLEVDRQRNMASYNVRLEAIDLYDSQMARIVLVPTNDESEEFYMSRANIGGAYVADEADQALLKATELQGQIDNNTYARNQISISVAGDGNHEGADQMLDAMKEELLTLADQVRGICSSYIESKRNGYLQIGLVPYSNFALLNVRSGIIGAFIFMAVCGGCLIMRQIWKENK